jgi:hypothetical protein
MPPPVPIQVVFQGGGAKLASLMAVCEVLQDSQKAGKIEITRTAGSSAGAISAVMLVSSKSVKDYYKGASKNCDQPSVTKESPPNDSGLFSLRFIGVLAVDVAVGACRQFFEVPLRRFRAHRPAPDA